MTFADFLIPCYLLALAELGVAEEYRHHARDTTPYGYGGGSGSGSTSSYSNAPRPAGANSLFAGSDLAKTDRVRTAHGVLAALAFVIFFPLGAISIRTVPTRLCLFIHTAFQIFGHAVFIAAFGLGVWMAREIDINLLKTHHPIIGIVIFSLLFFQPILGVLHHLGFKQHGTRGVASYIHIWLGRCLITLGIINGGLGLRLAGNASRSQHIAYGVVAGIIWIVWMIAAVSGELRRHSRANASKDPSSGTGDGTSRSGAS